MHWPYLTVGINALVVPFNSAYLGWCLLGQAALQRPSALLLAGLAAAALVFTAKAVFDAMMVCLCLTWKDVPVWGVPTSSQLTKQTKP